MSKFAHRPPLPIVLSALLLVASAALLAGSGCGSDVLLPPVVGDPPLPSRSTGPVDLPSIFTLYSEWIRPAEMIVRFRDSTTPQQAASLRQASNVEVIKELLGGLLQLLRVPAGTSLLSLVTEWAANDAVEYAEPNLVVKASAWPLSFPNVDDPLLPAQWNMRDIRVPEAWARYGPGSPSVTVAVVDTGVAYETSGLFERAPDLGTTRFASGYDFATGDSHPNDDQGHGTHVTGTIAQSTDNGLGCVGVAPDVTIMPVKVLSATGSGSSFDVAAGIRYAVDNGAQAINLSLGGPTPDRTMREACQYAYDHNVVIVAAAGNDSGDVGYPAGYSTTICVTATDRQRRLAPYSDHGPEVDVAAPGGDASVDSDHDGQPDGILQQTFADLSSPFPLLTGFDFVYLQGTSMATPHVTGAVAMLLSNGLNADNNTEAVRAILEQSCVDLGDPGRDPMFGYGLLQVDRALDVLAAGVPNPGDPWNPGDGESEPSPLPDQAVTLRPGEGSSWLQLGSPVDALPGEVFSPAPAELKTWDTTTQRWVPVDRLSQAGGAFVFLESPVSAMFDLRYRVGPSTEVSVPMGLGWTMVGNPYDRPMLWATDSLRVRRSETGDFIGTLQQAWDLYSVVGYAWMWDEELGRYVKVADREITPGETRASIPPFRSVWVRCFEAGLELVWRGVDLPTSEESAARTREAPFVWTGEPPPPL